MLFTSLKPMLLQMGNNHDIPDNNEWIYDIKWDGWRILLHKDGDKLEVYTRHGNKVTAKFPELQNVAKSIKEEKVILDCEGVVLRNGVSVFNDFSYRGRLSNKHKIQQATTSHPVTFIAFDTLLVNEPILNEPLNKRKELLASIIHPSENILVTPSIIGNGNEIFQLTKNKGMEGIVGKRINSIYKLNQRTYNWLKYKHFKTIKVTILGYKENPFTLLVGEQLDDGKYKTIANVEFGFTQEEKTAFRKIATQLIIKREKGIMWIEPLLPCNVEYLERTNTGSLRITSFKGFDFSGEEKYD